MAARTAQPIDTITLLHTGQVSVACAGFSDPAGNPWIVMNDTAGAVNAVQISNAATGNAPTITVGGAAADTNPGLTITAKGTGVTTVGSSVSAVTLAGTPTISSAMTVSSTLTVNGPVNASGFNSTTTVVAVGTINASTMGSCSAFSANVGATSSQFTVIQFGLGSSSTYQRPGIFVGSSFPSIVGPAPGSLFFLEGGTSSNMLLLAIPNGGTGSSSNWVQFLTTALSSAQ